MSIRIAFIFLMASAPIAPSVAQPAPAATAAPAPQPIARSVFMARIDRMFVATDVNKDGFADRNELTAGQIKEINARKNALLRQREAGFRQLDKDNNGSLTLVEFNAIIVAAPIRADASPALARFDTNKDGKVSLAENRAPALVQFDRADTNKDGSLSVAEQKAVVVRR